MLPLTRTYTTVRNEQTTSEKYLQSLSHKNALSRSTHPSTRVDLEPSTPLPSTKQLRYANEMKHFETKSALQMLRYLIPRRIRGLPGGRRQ